MMNFTAIDFETATSSRNSACSVALVEVKDDKLVDSYYALIRPPALRFNPFNIHIHGIHPEDRILRVYGRSWPSGWPGASWWRITHSSI